jgi:hypothetical protein
VKRWQRYWFADGGRGSAAVVRIALAIAVLLTLRQLATLSTVHIPASASIYRPVGLWMVLGYLVPPPFVVTGLWVVAIGATILMLVGLWSRATTAVSFVASLALASAAFSGDATWSHQYNVVFLAQLAFLGARGGDVLSIDALLRVRRGLPLILVPRGYQWSLRLVQFAVVLMFVGATFHKLLHGQFTLRWALSDNLRHHLLVAFDLAGRPRPAVADWLIDDVWRYRTAALLNLISQTAPILACIFVRRPLVRALAGGFFVIETLALGVVMGLWNLHWLPLAAVFIDWDRLVAVIARRPVAAAPTPDGWSPPRGQRYFVLVFVIYDLITALSPKLDQWLNTYPFTAFPMFSTVRARPPYDQHLPYVLPAYYFEVISDRPLDARTQRWIDHTYRKFSEKTDAKALENKLRDILAEVQRRFPELGIRGLRHWLAMFVAPAYPAPARFERHALAVTGEIDASGAFRTALGKLDSTGVTLRPQRLDLAGARLVIFRDDEVTPRALPAERTGERFATGPIDGDPLYVAVIIDGTPWLVASRKAWRWE